jgi:REP element-mobilizing transposase RayT
MKYNPAIHHRRSIRLKGYDYSQAGLYFVTICVHVGANGIRPNNDSISPNSNGIRPHIFGEVINGEMILNDAGKMVCCEWEKSAEIRKEIEIHEYIVMPNHFHGIIEIVGANGIRPNDANNNVIRPNNDDIIRANNNDDKGECHSPLRRSPSKTVGSLIRGFKSSITKQLGYSPWQRNYWEHIIRNEKSYQYVANYIINNPVKWEKDRFYEK